MVGIRKFNWLPQPSAWQQAQAWRARRAALTSDAINASDNFNNLFAKANDDKIKGLATLAGNAALKRINAAAKAKFDTIANTKIAGIDDVKTDTKVDKTA